MGLLAIKDFHIKRVSNGWILEYTHWYLGHTEVYEHFADMTYRIEILAQSLPDLEVKDAL